MERDSELVSATAQMKTESFREWAGGADIATVAIVFTDVIDSTKLNVESGDEPWRRVREAHFGSAKALVKKGDKVLTGQKIGDSEKFVSAPVHATTSGEISGTTVIVNPPTGALTGIDDAIRTCSQGHCW